MGGGWQPSCAIGTFNQYRFEHAAQNEQVLAGLSRRWFSGFLQKIFDVAASKALDSPDLVTSQFATPDHPINRHRRKLQQFCELSDGVELGLGVVSQSRYWHLPSPLY
jgi:hypothetical protein